MYACTASERCVRFASPVDFSVRTLTGIEYILRLWTSTDTGWKLRNYQELRIKNEAKNKQRSITKH